MAMGMGAENSSPSCAIATSGPGANLITELMLCLTLYLLFT